MVGQQAVVWIGGLCAEYGDVGFQAGRELADSSIQRQRLRRIRRDHLDPVRVLDHVGKLLLVELRRHAQLIEDVITARGIPIDSE